MISSKDSELALIPPKVRLLYKDFKLISQAHHFKNFSAVSNANSQKYTVRVLDLSSEFYNSNPNLTATLFIQELLRLCMHHPTAVFAEDFEICDKAMAFVSIPYTPLDLALRDVKNSHKPNIEKLVKDVLEDLSFLVYDLRLNYKNSLRIELDNIYQLSKNKGYILGDWAKGLGNDKVSLEVSEAYSKKVDVLNGDKEVQIFAAKVLELTGAKKEDLEDLKVLQELMGTRNPKMYLARLEVVLNGLNLTSGAKKAVTNMFSKEGESKLRLIDFIKPERKIRKNEPFKISRFEKTEGIWNFGSDANIDAVGFKTTVDLQLTGIGLYVPEIDKLEGGD